MIVRPWYMFPCLELSQGCSEQIALEGQDLPRTYLAQHEGQLESIKIIIIIRAQSGQRRQSKAKPLGKSPAQHIAPTPTQETALTHPPKKLCPPTHPPIKPRPCIHPTHGSVAHLSVPHPTPPKPPHCTQDSVTHLSVGLDLTIQRLLHGPHSGQLFFQCFHALPAASLLLLHHKGTLPFGLH